jgi:hypothetical protein
MKWVLSNVSEKDVELAKLDEADKATLMESLGILNLPSATARLAKVLSNLSGKSDVGKVAVVDAVAGVKPTPLQKPILRSPLNYADVRQKVNETAIPFKKSGNAYNVSSEENLNALYNDITFGASPTEAKGYNGLMKVLPDGTLIGLRNSSATGGATIDVFPAAGKNYKVHIAP